MNKKVLFPRGFPNKREKEIFKIVLIENKKYHE